MYETETSPLTASLDELPDDAVARFAELRDRVTHRSLIPWTEHCTECAMPGCFATCAFYTPRDDLKCRRFVGGFVGIDAPNAAAHRLMKITFRKWGKLEGAGSTRLYPLAQALRRERLDVGVSRTLRGLPLPYQARVQVTKTRYRRKAATAARAESGVSVKPNCFVVECFNPAAEPVAAVLTIRPRDPAVEALYRENCVFAPGYNRQSIPIEEITRFVNLGEAFLTQLEPQANGGGVVLYFGVVDFALDNKLAARAKLPRKPRRAKCVVWDLDNTLWRGTLIEDGADNLVLNEAAVDLIKALDARGILNSIASKNNPEDALKVIESFGLSEYFLHPDISWEPKSQALERIAGRLNIGIDTLVFIDDQPFERAEVAAAHPDVACVDPAELDGLLDNPLFDVPVTPESRKRRQFYREQEVRHEAQANASSDYEAFLRQCGLVLSVEPLSESSLNRVFELAQRTNQMNFSGNRYPRKVLEEMLERGDRDTYVLSCRDRFGEYGIIGFSIVDPSPADGAVMQDLMFSCRIQSKRIEHAFLADVLQRYRTNGRGPFRVLYNKTAKNTPSARVFADLGFDERNVEADRYVFEYPTDKDIPTDDIVEIERAD